MVGANRCGQQRIGTVGADIQRFGPLGGCGSRGGHVRRRASSQRPHARNFARWTARSDSLARVPPRDGSRGGTRASESDREPAPRPAHGDDRGRSTSVLISFRRRGVPGRPIRFSSGWGHRSSRPPTHSSAAAGSTRNVPRLVESSGGLLTGEGGHARVPQRRRSLSRSIPV